MKLRIDISLDNAAMTDPDTIATVIQKLADKISSHINWTEWADESFTAIPTGPNAILDPNGNNVGVWQVTD